MSNPGLLILMLGVIVLAAALLLAASAGAHAPAEAEAPPEDEAPAPDAPAQDDIYFAAAAAEAAPVAPAPQAKKEAKMAGKAKPLTRRVFDALRKHGPGTTDAVARRVRVKSKVAGKALSAIKARGLVAFEQSDGEAVWRATADEWPKG